MQYYKEKVNNRGLFSFARSLRHSFETLPPTKRLLGCLVQLAGCAVLCCAGQLIACFYFTINAPFTHTHIYMCIWGLHMLHALLCFVSALLVIATAAPRPLRPTLRFTMRHQLGFLTHKSNSLGVNLWKIMPHTCTPGLYTNSSNKCVYVCVCIYAFFHSYNYYFSLYFSHSIISRFAIQYLVASYSEHTQWELKVWRLFNDFFYSFC